MTKQTPRAAIADRIQVNVRLPRSCMEDLMRLAGLEQSERGERVTQQHLVERAVDDLVAKLRSKHSRSKS